MKPYGNKFIITVFSLMMSISWLSDVNAQSLQTDRECLISLWNHQWNFDPANVVQQLGFNLIWSHDKPYTGQGWEETHMYKMLQIPGVKYVFAKIERAAWGWTHEQSLAHQGILGMYLNDFYDEIEEGYRTEEQWREIIASAKEVNPNLQLWVPDYPHRNQFGLTFVTLLVMETIPFWG